MARPYEVVRNAGELASKLIFLGEFAALVQGGNWALRECERLGVKDGVRRLYIVNNWAYARLLAGDLVGLEALLHEGEAQLAEAEPTFAYLFRSSLADYLLASGRSAEALPYYRRNYQEVLRWSLASAALDLVRADCAMSDGAC